MMFIMSRVFLDSNILIYLYTTDEKQRNLHVKDLLKSYEDIVMSTQVAFEFSYVMRRKFKQDYSSIEKALDEFRDAFEVTIITYDMLLGALKIASKYNYSFPDSLIITAAINADCDILFSEDMHTTQVIENKLKIINPFLQ